MFTFTAHVNEYLRVGQNTTQAVLSVKVDDTLPGAPAPLALGIVLDRSGSMGGEKMAAAREGAIQVIQALDENIVFMLVTFNHEVRVVYGPAQGTADHKQKAIRSLQGVFAAGGTCMSLPLNAVVDKLSRDRSRTTKILFLTDGRNEGEPQQQLKKAIEHCAAANVSVHAWGVGVDWDEDELRTLANATHGSADIIPTPKQVATAFTASFNEIRKTAIMNARLLLWSPAGVTVKAIQQVYPQLIPLTSQPNALNPRQQAIELGSFTAGEQREYLCDLEMPGYAPGQQFMVLRPSMAYTMAGMGEQEEKSGRPGWVFVQWTEDAALAAQIEQHVAHYTNQGELAQFIKEGQQALAAGDRDKATRLLARALEISQSTNNERITRLLGTIVIKDANGTVRLNDRADAVARKTLSINIGRTNKLK
jgi:Ca-activated chloride channel family protein